MVTLNLRDEWCYYACKLVALLPIWRFIKNGISNNAAIQNVFFIESVCIMSQLGINQ